MKMIPCTTCQKDMPELRKTQFGYTFCVECSENLNLVGKKCALPIQRGTGDNTWNETIIMDESEYNDILKQEELHNKHNKKMK